MKIRAIQTQNNKYMAETSLSSYADFIGREDVLMVNDAYYYIGHFSKYIQKNAVRTGSSKYISEIETVSFKNPDGTIVSVVLNRTEKDVDFAFRIADHIVESVAQAHSISTYIFEE